MDGVDKLVKEFQVLDWEVCSLYAQMIGTKDAKKQKALRKKLDKAKAKTASYPLWVRYRAFLDTVDKKSGKE